MIVPSDRMFLRLYASRSNSFLYTFWPWSKYTKAHRKTPIAPTQSSLSASNKHFASIDSGSGPSSSGEKGHTGKQLLRISDQTLTLAISVLLLLLLQPHV